MTEIADFLITTIPIRWIRMLKIAGENVGLSGLAPPPFFKKRCNPTVVQAQLLINECEIENPSIILFFVVYPGCYEEIICKHSFLSNKSLITMNKPGESTCFMNHQV